MSLDTPSLLFLTVFALTAWMIGLSKGGLGGTLGALATPLMALVMPAHQVIGLLLPVLMFADVFAVAFHWGYWERRLLLLLLPGSLVGVILGTLFLSRVSPHVLKLTLGLITLIFAVYKLGEGRIQRRLPYRSAAWHGYLAGGVAGFSSTLAHNGGPPASIYLLLQGISPRAFIATSAVFFAILNWLKVPFYWQAGLFDARLLAQVVLPAVALVPTGVWVGRWLGLRLPQRRFEQVIVFLLLVTGLLLVYQAVPGLRTTAVSRPEPWRGPVPVTAHARLGKGTALALALSPTGDRLVVGSQVGLFLYKTDTGAEQWAVPTMAAAERVLFSRDGAWIAAVLRDETVVVLAADDGHPVAVPPAGTEWLPVVPIAALAPALTAQTIAGARNADGGLWATAAEDGRVAVWQPPFTAPMTTISGFSPRGWRTAAVAWSPDGRMLAMSSGPEVWLWSADGRLQQRLQAHSRQVNSLAWSPDGRRLASGSWDATVALWDPRRGRLLHRLRGHDDAVWAVAWAPDGRHLVSSGSLDNRVIVWNAAQGRELTRLAGTDAGVWGLAWSPDGDTLAVGTTAGDILLWDMRHEPAANPVRTLRGHLTWITALAWSPDGRWLASAAAEPFVIVWDVAQGRRRFTLPGHQQVVRALAFSPDGRRLATGALDGVVRVWSLDPAAADEASAPVLYRNHTAGVLALTWAPAGLVSGSDDGTAVMMEEP